MISSKERARILGLLPAFLVFGFVANLGMLVSPLFMMQMLDRVVPSGNMATLLLLLLVAVVFVVFSAIIDAKRYRILRDLGLWVEGRYLDALTPKTAPNLLQDIPTLQTPTRYRQLLAILDLPWAVLFAIVLFLIHPLFVVPVLVALLIAVYAEAVWGSAQSEADSNLSKRQMNLLSVYQRLGSVRATMNLERNLLGWFTNGQGNLIAQNAKAYSTEEKNQAIKASARQLAQISLLAIGGMLVAQSELTAGGMIAASLIGSKTLSLSETAYGAWPHVPSTLGLLRTADLSAMTELDRVEAIEGDLVVDSVTVPKGRTGGFRLQQVSFSIPAGACLAVVGAAGSGKSTLLGCLSGADTIPLGQVSLGGHDLKRLDAGQRQSAIGLVPQAPAFHFGTIAENISCFSEQSQTLAVEEAAMLAGVHSTVLGLPDGYATDLATQSYLLSAGQLQKLALARAVYHKPQLLILDEPNAHQDNLGEQQMGEALARVKASGCTIVMALHRTALLWLADQALVLDRGRVVDFGDRSSVLARRGRTNRVIDLPLTMGGVQDVEDWISGQFNRSSDIELKYRAVVVATELFNFLRTTELNQKRASRVARMTFTFIGSNGCEISIKEERDPNCTADASSFDMTPDGKYLIDGGSNATALSFVLLSKSADDLKLDFNDDAVALSAKLGMAA